MQRSILKQQISIFGEYHRSTCVAMGNLAVTLNAREALRKAFELQESVLSHL